MKKLIASCIVAGMCLTFVPSSLAASDINGHWAETELNTLIEKEIMNGYDDGTFKPNNDITRAEFAKLIMKTLEQVPTNVIEVHATEIPVLSDLNPDDKSQGWYYNEVVAAIELGIITGFSDGTFKATNKITRQEIAAMIIRALKTRGVQSTPADLTFSDNSKIPNWSLEDIQHVVSLEIMQGQSNNQFAPTKEITRAEVAAVLVRTLDILAKETTVEGSEQNDEATEENTETDENTEQDRDENVGGDTEEDLDEGTEQDSTPNPDPTVEYSHYNITIDEMVNKQMTVSPQTDLYSSQLGYISGEYIINVFTAEDEKTYGFVNADALRVRSTPTTESTDNIIGMLNSSPTNPIKVHLRSEVINEKDELWYEVYYGSWSNAKKEDVAYYVNPNNFTPGSKEYFQFLVLSKPAGITADELDSKILAGKGVLEGLGEIFVSASQFYNINEIYLVSHALLETGNGMSDLAQGTEIEYFIERKNGVPLVDENGETVKTPVEPRTVYNFFGIGAVDTCPNDCGSERAYKEGWFSPEAAVFGGAKYIAERYIHHPKYLQDTLYKMRWNPDIFKDPTKIPEHQYATDIGWAVKQVNRMYEMYQLLDNYSLYYDVPVYQ